MLMLAPFRPSRVIAQLAEENKRLREHLDRAEIALAEERALHWEAKTEPARTLAILIAKDKEIGELKKMIHALKRERDRAGRFAPCEK
ncbi:hypothetical protein HW509_10660 [Asaia spathodeae]|uniref:hypothetical protein n=1 Tax=Asaia spathodeae TaxID=657016 RepID=UPI002FC2A43F